MATLIDTSALIVFLRRQSLVGFEVVAAATEDRIRAGGAILSSITVTELLVGARNVKAEVQVRNLLERLPAIAFDRELAVVAGRMGRAARATGRIVPLPDLAIAASAVWLGVPLLTLDSDFSRGVELAREAREGEPWYGFELDPASVVA